MESSLDIKKFVNNIFIKKGVPPVKNFASEFADGSKYLIFILICQMAYSSVLTVV